MKVFVFDGSWKGLLTCVFQSFFRKLTPDQIVLNEKLQYSFVDEIIFIETCEEEAQRTWDGLSKKFSYDTCELIYKVFLSELDECYLLIIKLVKLLYQNSEEILEDFSNPTSLRIHQIDKMLRREVHRFHAFVRFEKNEGVFQSLICPDFNIIPLLGDFFQKRFADQLWLIFDTKRKYGIYYDLEQVSEVAFSDDATNERKGFSNILSSDSFYTDLWRTYFDSVNIVERKNIKLHLQHIPKRYWKYLPEKKI